MRFSAHPAGLVPVYSERQPEYAGEMKILITLLVIIAVAMVLLWIRKTFSKEIDRARSIRRAEGKPDGTSE